MKFHALYFLYNLGTIKWLWYEAIAVTHNTVSGQCKAEGHGKIFTSNPFAFFFLTFRGSTWVEVKYCPRVV